MFGYSGGDAPDVKAHKVLERQRAHDQWPFLTTLDLSTLHTESQLASIVKDRASLSAEGAEAEVGEWMVGYRARMSYPYRSPSTDIASLPAPKGRDRPAEVRQR